MLSFLQPLAHIVAKFFLDGKEYQVDHFKVGFSQPVDFKGQPQHEMKGGQLKVVLSQMADDNLYDWAKQSTKLKSGVIAFQTEMSSPILTIKFENAYCIELTCNIDALTGTTTTLILAPEEVAFDDIDHNNFWKK